MVIPETSPFLTYAEAAAYLRISKPTLRRYIQSGKLKAVRWAGRHPKVTQAELARFAAGDVGAAR